MGPPGLPLSLDTGGGFVGLRGWQAPAGLLEADFLRRHCRVSSLSIFSREAWGWAPGQWPQTINLT
jgi:hypothetical protein